ncbi:MAG: hypothetical protein IH945_12940, partial [Armatimonadetes bacterium]|nr:hypothetical protein [Armatimonadota bacterium]
MPVCARALSILVFVVASAATRSGQEATDLPRVLLIGDSISGGYKNFVIEELEG